MNTLELLRALADSPDEFDLNGSIALLRHHGEELLLTLRRSPGAGDCVIDEATGEAIAVERFVQHRLLDLERLARQITHIAVNREQDRPVKYVESGSVLTEGGRQTAWNPTSRAFLDYLAHAPIGSTRLVLLSAEAGAGKTVLLERTAQESARDYMADTNPPPLVLPVDLLGRYVGTIDDAIAGSLNNTYIFPKLTQRDVLVALRKGWLILALDGFDELVARIGHRDSFLRLNDLVDQLASSGTLVLSARASFFEQMEVKSAIAAYLQPRTGSFARSDVTLNRWGTQEAVRVLALLNSGSPERDVQMIFDVFAENQKLLSEPFLFTRIAKMWREGEDFRAIHSVSGELAQTAYLIAEFTRRETDQKWIGKDSRPILTPENHEALLAGIAREMWTSAAFRMTADELQIACEISLEPKRVSSEVLQQVKQRVATHAALSTSGRQSAFKHEKFLKYFLAVGLVDDLAKPDLLSLRRLLGGPDVGPEIAKWVHWLLRERGVRPPQSAQDALCEIAARGSSDPARTNAATILALVLELANEPVEITNVTFHGEMLLGRTLARIAFRSCRFWHIDLRRTSLIQCSLYSCEIGDAVIDATTSLKETMFADSLPRVVVSGVEEDAKSWHAPEAIAKLLRGYGAAVGTATVTTSAASIVLRPEVIEAVEWIVRRSNRLWDQATEEIESEHGDVGSEVVKRGIACGVFKRIEKTTSGPRKLFIRLAVDRGSLLDGWRDPGGSGPVADFWQSFAARGTQRR